MQIQREYYLIMLIYYVMMMDLEHLIHVHGMVIHIQ